MWGLGILVVLVIYVFFIRFLAGIFDNPRNKLIYYSVTVIVPCAYPFIYLLYPSYHEFQSLCNQRDRIEIFNTKLVDIFYLGKNSECSRGYTVLSKYSYKGIECDIAPAEADIRVYNERGMFGYERGDNWSTPLCRDKCLNMNNLMEKRKCSYSCLKRNRTNDFTESYSYNLEKKEIIENRLVLFETRVVDNELGLMAKTKNYFYYPYGNTWAKILGADSGIAPKEKCNTQARINAHEIFKPRT